MQLAAKSKLDLWVLSFKINNLIYSVSKVAYLHGYHYTPRARRGVF
jgi:hypothetical protein